MHSEKKKRLIKKHTKILGVDEGIGFMGNFFLFLIFQMVWKFFKASRNIGRAPGACTEECGGQDWLRKAVRGSQRAGWLLWERCSQEVEK